MTKTRQPADNMPDTPEGAGEGGVEEGVAMAATEDRGGGRGMRQQTPLTQTKVRLESGAQRGHIESGRDGGRGVRGRQREWGKVRRYPKGGIYRGGICGKGFDPPVGKHAPT